MLVSSLRSVSNDVSVNSLKKKKLCLLKCFSGECRVFSKATEFLSPTEILAGCWNSMALTFLKFPQI